MAEPRVEATFLLFPSVLSMHTLLRIAPLFPWDLLGSYYFLSKFYCSSNILPPPSPAGSHRRVNFSWAGSLSQVQSVHCAPAPSGEVSVRMWQGKRFSPCTSLPSASACVSACGNAVPVPTPACWQGCTARGLAVVFHIHRKIDLCFGVAGTCQEKAKGEQQLCVLLK